MKCLSLVLLGGYCMLAASVSCMAQASTNVPVALSANSGSLSGLPDRYGHPTPDSRGWTDPALNHNKLLIGEGVYQLVATYKVKGSQFLFGQRHEGDLYGPTEKAQNIYVSYNTYNQEVEFYSSSNPNDALVKEPGTLDSFFIHTDTAMGIVESLKFVYGPLLGAKDKSYYEEIYSGSRYGIYKKYKSDLGYDPENYAQSDLRQFDLNYEYYYTDKQEKTIKKLKANPSNIIKEFKNVKDLSPVATEDGFSNNPEIALRKVFRYLNQDLKGF